MSAIFVTCNGGYWLQCFADDPDAEKGAIVYPLDAGDNWDTLVAKVAEHRAEHGCDA
jgi:hypothetical protein